MTLYHQESYTLYLISSDHLLSAVIGTIETNRFTVYSFTANWLWFAMTYNAVNFLLWAAYLLFYVSFFPSLYDSPSAVLSLDPSLLLTKDPQCSLFNPYDDI